MSLETVFERAQRYVDQFDYELASKCLVKILSKLDPIHIPSLELLGMVSNELEDYATAYDCYYRLISTNHESFKTHPSTFQWYLCLAQLCDGEEALRHYESAAKLLKKKILEDSSGVENGQKVLCGIYCSMAEIYFTDFGSQPSSDAAALNLLTNALQTDDKNPEVHYLFAQISLNQENKEAAKEYLEKSFLCWQDLDPVTDGDSYPAVEFRLQVAKLSIELELIDEAIELLELLSLQIEDCVDVWYLLGVALSIENNSETLPEASDALSKAFKMLTEENGQPIEPAEEYLDMLRHIKELTQKLGDQMQL